jgi:hypothetical protein
MEKKNPARGARRAQNPFLPLSKNMQIQMDVNLNATKLIFCKNKMTIGPKLMSPD